MELDPGPGAGRGGARARPPRHRSSRADDRPEGAMEKECSVAWPRPCACRAVGGHSALGTGHWRGVSRATGLSVYERVVCTLISRRLASRRVASLLSTSGPHPLPPGPALPPGPPAHWTPASLDSCGTCSRVEAAGHTSWRWSPARLSFASRSQPVSCQPQPPFRPPPSPGASVEIVTAVPPPSPARARHP